MTLYHVSNLYLTRTKPIPCGAEVLVHVIDIKCKNGSLADFSH